MDFAEPILFEPIAMDRVWGGRKLESLFGKPLPHGAPIGELWELVDRPEAQSVVHNGPLRGSTLNDLWTRHREIVFGATFASHPAPRFPLLIKLLDARERLSIQVHPPAAIAPALGGEPKTEMWYFADASPGARIYAGLRAGVNRAQFEELLAIGKVDQAVHEIPVEKGDSIFIPSGRIHAIGEGCVIVEIQQNSDTTYRVFDWNRLGLDGRPRTLHVEESLASIDFEDFEPGVERVLKGVLAQCPFFEVERLPIPPDPVPAGVGEAFVLYAVVVGSVLCGGVTTRPGGFFLVPAAAPGLTLSSPDKGAVLKITLPSVRENVASLSA